MLSVPSISVVIPAHNEQDYIADCIRSVLNHRTGAVKEIIVVDNASTDRTAAVARGFPGVTVVAEPRTGTGFARHRGFEVATGDLVAYIDADSRVREEWFIEAEKQFMDHPEIVSLSGPYWFYDLPGVRSVLVYLWWMALCVPAHWVRGFTIVGGNFVVRRSALQAIGGFDTNIAFYGDDTNLSRRLHAVGTVKFTTAFWNESSARRLIAQGFLRTGMLYGINYLSQAFFGKSVTKGEGGRPWEHAKK